MPQQLACENLSGGSSNYRNAVVALSLADGSIKWGTKLGGADAWNAACFQQDNANCPAVAGPDYGAPARRPGRPEAHEAHLHHVWELLLVLLLLLLCSSLGSGSGEADPGGDVGYEQSRSIC